MKNSDETVECYFINLEIAPGVFKNMPFTSSCAHEFVNLWLPELIRIEQIYLEDNDFENLSVIRKMIACIEEQIDNNFIPPEKRHVTNFSYKS